MDQASVKVSNTFDGIREIHCEFPGFLYGFNIAEGSRLDTVEIPFVKRIAYEALETRFNGTYACKNSAAVPHGGRRKGMAAAVCGIGVRPGAEL